MDPRDIIRRDQDRSEDPLQVLIDTASMNEQLSFGNSDAPRLLQYHANEHLRFVRTPEQERHDDLDTIPAYEFEESDDARHSIHIEWEPPRGTVNRTVAFWYNEGDIKKRAARVYSSNRDDYATEEDIEELTEQQVETVKKAFVQAALNRSEDGQLFVTENETLLSNRRWFENHFPGVPLNVMNLTEAIEYVGLYLRYRDVFLLGPKYRIDKFGWYWHLFRSLIPHYHVEADADDDYMRGFGTRLQNLLIALDELGNEYFQEPSNRVKMEFQYHFDYAISLITGVFDALALKTAAKCGIEGIDKEYISLSNNRGRDFLTEVRSNNSQLREHIADHMEYINLIYVLRPLVIHRGGYQDGILADSDANWEAGTIMLDQLNSEDEQEFLRYYRELDDEPLPYDPLSKWGMYRPDDDSPDHLEPYHFLKQAVFTLIDFADEYLALLGYSDFLEDHEDTERGGDFSDTCRRIQEDALTHFS